jgi:peptidoglycan hydrolase-like protein with peptidoglycan-binding domain
MKKMIIAVLSLCFACSIAFATHNPNLVNPQGDQKTSASKRKPIFRANSEQVKQAQTILKQRGFYGGELTGKLAPDTRAGLKKYQQAESLPVTGTLNKVTLEKMGVTLTDQQKTM